MLLALLPLAMAASFQVRATVTPRGVQGTLTGPVGQRYDDPLARLPEPPDDLSLQRTYPGAQDSGGMLWSQAQGVLEFETELPHRYGALGWARTLQGNQLWANGGWYPQPLSGPDLPIEVHDWQVTLELPQGAVGVLNGVSGGGTLSWSGQAERLSIAVFEGGELVELAPDLVLLRRGPARPRRDQQLVRLWQAVPNPRAPAVVVEAPMFRRLTREGPGVLYLSEMAWRTPKALWRFHNQAVAQALVQVSVDHPLALLRELYAASLDLGEQLQSATADQVLRWGAFLPLVDMLLYSGRVPFHAELFGELYPGDPLRDDLEQLYSERPTGQVIAAKIDGQLGQGTAYAWALEWMGEVEFTQIQSRLAPWTGHWPEQDYTLDLHQGQTGWVMEVERHTSEGAPSETVEVAVDGELLRWQSGLGPGSQSIPLEQRPERVVLDPKGQLAQTERSGERWPARWTTVATLTPQSYDLTQGILVGHGLLRLRKQYDTHNLTLLSAATDAQNRLSLQGGLTRYFGPLQDRRLRAYRLSVWGGGAWLSPEFGERVDGQYALELGSSLTWDTRVDWRFPLSGHRLRASVELGVVPQSGHRWSSASASVSAVHALHPRLVLAGTLSGGLASGQVQHRLLSLGGSLQSLSPSLVVGQQRGSAAVELRLLAVKNASVPLLWLYWLDEVQLTAGLEAGAVGQSGLVSAGAVAALTGSNQALGARGSVLLTLDGLGAIPWTVGLVAGVPLWVDTELATQELGPQLGLSLGQSF